MDIASRAGGRPLARATCLMLGGLLAASLVPPAPATAQTSTSCRNTASATPEQYGPTDVSAVSGNQRLSVGLNPDATVTVLKWPSPSYYDQIKYRTTDRSEPRFGAQPNEGAFLGLGFRKGSRNWQFAWLRDWTSRQRFADDDGDEVVTVFRNPRHGLRVVVRDVVVHNSDTLTRVVSVRKSKWSAVTRARVISFANFNPVYSKRTSDPSDDWCDESDNDEGAAYNARHDAIVHARSGVDESTGQPASVAMVMGFDGSSTGFEVGVDAYQTGTTGMISAYDDAGDARLSGNDTAAGQADAAIADDIGLSSRRAGRTVVHISAAHTSRDAISLLNQMRDRNIRAIRRGKTTWWRRWLDSARIPEGAPPVVVKVAKRSLISIRQTTDRRGLIVASISTQPPLGLDWVRHGAYINKLLHAAGHPGMVRKHNIRYAQLQAGVGDTTPPGNWAENYYADGTPGGPRTHEIDQTGLGMWTLWDHFATTRDRPYLFQAADSVVYEAIQRAAHYLSDSPPIGCRDPATGLYSASHDETSTQPRQSLVGAQAIWLGLGAAADAARELGSDTSQANATKWETRRDELGTAIRQNYLDPECNCYTTDYRIGGTTLWPVRLVRYGSKIANGQAAANWHHIRRAMNGAAERGGQESRALLGNAFAWQRSPRKMRQIRNALRWVASTTATPTGLLGNDWMRYPEASGPIVAMSGQPHSWNHAMFYLAALKAYGAAPWSP